ncbi:MAG: GNAT family N-acetyltransferase, partial [Planctomycetes bacterium]|nr:GNAT family N-acetyltransferase [Planctomycetota bacterium]
DSRAISDLRALPQSYTNKGGEFWLVEVQDAVVGTAGIRPSATSGMWNLECLALVPAWRGMGLGRMLAEKAIQFAREKGATVIAVRLHPEMKAALSLFESLRFHPVGDFDPEEATQPFEMRRRF